MLAIATLVGSVCQALLETGPLPGVILEDGAR